MPHAPSVGRRWEAKLRGRAEESRDEGRRSIARENPRSPDPFHPRFPLLFSPLLSSPLLSYPSSVPPLPQSQAPARLAMAEGTPLPANLQEGEAISVTSQVEALFHRRIEFHPARKPLSSFPNGDFRLETLNPSSGPGTSAERIGGASTPSKGNRSVEAEFCEFGFDPELSCRITFRRIVSLFPVEFGL